MIAYVATEDDMKALMTALAALLVGMPAYAQQHGPTTAEHGQHRGGPMMAHCTEKMGGPAPAMLLAHREELELSAEQVQQLEALQEEMKAHMAGHGATPRDTAAHAGQHRQHRQHGQAGANHEQHAGMHAKHSAFAAQAAAVLTQAQRLRLHELMQHAGKRGHGAGAEHRKAEGADGGAKQCPMRGGSRPPGATGGHDGHSR
jgi:hypothetical protein